MDAVEPMASEGRMTILRGKRASGRAAFIVKGPARQEKLFWDLEDAEHYYRYYVQRCRQEDPSSQRT